MEVVVVYGVPDTLSQLYQVLPEHSIKNLYLNNII